MGTLEKIENKINIINELHSKIEKNFKDALSIAIQIGGHLVEVKKETQHGEFVSWIKNECTFSERTASRYMQLFNFKYAIEEVSDFNEAYKLADEERKRLKNDRMEEINREVDAFLETGKKSSNWGDDHEFFLEDRKNQQYEKESKETEEDENDLSVAGVLGSIFKHMERTFSTEQPLEVKKLYRDNIIKMAKRLYDQEKYKN